MDKNAIKKYAVWARRELISRVSQKALQYGISDAGFGDKNADSVNGILLTADQKKQRKALIEKIEQYGADKKAFEQVIEEVAYTWFNRFTALRFMEVNGYLPTHIRVFTDDNNEFKPQILAEAIHLDLDGLKQDVVFKLKEENKEEELYKYLLITQCNALNSVLPIMFQKISDYTELLFPDNLLRDESLIGRMITEIPQGDWDVGDDGQVEIIGWLYQYYISEKHEEVVDPLHGKVVKKEDVPAATQLFTTDWVVRYITDNSVGRYWIERKPNSDLANKLEYFVMPKDGITAVNEHIDPKELTVLDPCVGSGHFLVYAFEVLMKVYAECGYSTRDAVRSIVENNLYGLDIDERATQLAYFAVMMKACAYDSRFLSRGVQPKIYAIVESNDIHAATLEYFDKGNLKLKHDILSIVNDMHDAKEYGSIIQVKPVDFNALYERFAEIENEPSIVGYSIETELLPVVKVAEVLAKKYKSVITNPPYLNKYSPKLRSYVDGLFKDYNGDLFSIFMYRNFGFCEVNGFSGFMTPNVWMFIKTYEKLRRVIFEKKSVNSLVQMAKGAFFKEATVDVCAFVLCNSNKNQIGTYIRLDDFKGDMDVQNKYFLAALRNKECGYYFESSTRKFVNIPGCPLAYWISDNFMQLIAPTKTIREISNPCIGMRTGDNDRFLRYWHEIDHTKMSVVCKTAEEVVARKVKWIPYNKGGDFRRWFGNNEYVVNWENDGYEIKENTKLHYGENIGWKISNEKFYFRKGITWGAITSAVNSFRYYDAGFIFSNSGQAVIMDDDKNLDALLAFLNTKIIVNVLKIISPTLSLESGYVAKLPFRREIIENATTPLLARENVEIVRKDWDSFESSWDFAKHPLIRNVSKIAEAYAVWEEECRNRFDSLKKNEEDINRFFIEVYGLQEELSHNVEDKDVSVRLADLQREIKSLISYAVGCMFGRYSLDVEGLAYAGGEWDASKYRTIIPDTDNIIPICDDEYFEDDIVGRFVQFVRVVYGEDTLEENLTFIANALGGNGSARDVIRDYFNKGFYADHLKTYQKRPIYWLFDSGKKGGFKALIYMHRYRPDTIARMRTDYVHEQQARYRAVIADLERRIDSASTSERVKLNKQLIKLREQAEEILTYEEKIHHLADQMINIDLDDGVVVNYAKFQDVLAKIK